MYFKFNREEGAKMESLAGRMSGYAPAVVRALASEIFNKGREKPFTACCVLLVSTQRQPRQQLSNFSPLMFEFFLAERLRIREQDFALLSGSAGRMVDFLAKNPQRVTSLSEYTQSGGIFFVWQEAPTVLAVASYCHELSEAAAIALAVLGVMLDEQGLRQVLAESPNRWVTPLLKEMLVRYPDHQHLKKVFQELETQASS